MSTDPWGVVREYEDALQVRRVPSPESVAAIHRGMGIDPDQPLPDSANLLMLKAGKPHVFGQRGDVQLESGDSHIIDGSKPLNLPLGYHTFHPERGPSVRLIVTPGRCYLPADLKIWGWAAQLYAARSRASWGIGDLADLDALAKWSRSGGANLVLINPLHAAPPGEPQESSPYYPSSRRFRNPLYLRIEDVPGFAELAGTLAPLAAAGRALNDERHIDRDAVYRLKMQALAELWRHFKADNRFEAYRREQGAALDQFAAYCVLAEKMGANWRSWPAEYHASGSPAIAGFIEQHSDRFRLWQWLQWLLDEQLARAAGHVRLMQDLPIGSNPDGADAWAWQDCLARDTALGAPPDRYIRLGQNWGLPPFVPHRLRGAGYQPFIDIVRSTLRHAGGLRIDHVLGLFRSFWIPNGMPAKDGAYVRYPVDELLGILALESERAKAFVVGEDLGTVEPGVRERLAEYNLLSYAVVWFESDPPAKYPRRALAAITTHDLPTIAGLWNGSDLAELEQLGVQPNVEGQLAWRKNLAKLAQVDDDARIDQVIVQAHRGLAAAPSMVMTATLEDALAVEERTNVPGTMCNQRPNWSLALPQPIEELPTIGRAREIAQALATR